MLNFRLSVLSMMFLSGIRLHRLFYLHSSFFTQKAQRKERGVRRKCDLSGSMRSLSDILI